MTDMGKPLRVIARVRNDFPTKFGLPRQSGLAESLRSLIVFEKAFRVPEALRGLEAFSHIWLIWGFHQARRDAWSPTVRPPKLGGNTRMGVFATRSPFRPNALGLSCVRLERIVDLGEAGRALLVSGADMMDGTPVYDVKPYLPYADCRPEAVGGFADAHVSDAVPVDFPAALLARVPEDRRAALLEALRQDPRPAYQADDTRVYGMPYAGLDIRFCVQDGVLRVCDVAEDAKKE
ncbi:MAG: tRNA (N6-threonylcarbamoyladenosine(37)-N6)-methyltransferase TrmO [Clostridiales bacterium]|nr:tRNA (N6-threonylcarbamoyladenosine(37)-N6)-methyltransferase TrmO [Clostridiales bacterium]